MHAYFGRIIGLRRRAPHGRPGLAPAGRVDGEGLSDAEVRVLFCWLLLIAGNETTRNLIALGALALADHPDQLARLRSEPRPAAPRDRGDAALVQSRDPHGPHRHARPRAARPRGRQGSVRRAALRRRQPRRGRVRTRRRGVPVTRHPNPHLAFGSGEHFCLGAGLARLEARVFFEELLARFGAIGVAGPVARVRSSMVPGVRHMPLRLAA